VSDLAAAAAHVIDLGAGPELAVAATKTYSAELLVIAMLATALEGRLSPSSAAGHARELDEVPAALIRALATETDTEAAAEGFAERDRCIVVGRGFEYATARELALKLKELARVAADPYSAADFLHGPLALIEAGYPVIAIAPSGATADDVDAVIARLRQLDATVMVLSDRPAALSIGSPGIALPTSVPEWLRPITTIVTGQFFALHLARARGIDPESPRWIRKVTLTR
jgi:glucosamine--fructose-6-phosphate aminotransferase (isomerizing)